MSLKSKEWMERYDDFWMWRNLQTLDNWRYIEGEGEAYVAPDIHFDFQQLVLQLDCDGVAICLRLAKESGIPERVERLLASETYKDGYRPVNLAIFNSFPTPTDCTARQIRMLGILQANGASLVLHNSADGGRSLLHSAAFAHCSYRDRYDLVCFLVGAGADLAEPYPDGKEKGRGVLQCPRADVRSPFDAPALFSQVQEAWITSIWQNGPHPTQVLLRLEKEERWSHISAVMSFAYGYGLQVLPHSPRGFASVLLAYPDTSPSQESRASVASSLALIFGPNDLPYFRLIVSFLKQVRPLSPPPVGKALV